MTFEEAFYKVHDPVIIQKVKSISDHYHSKFGLFICPLEQSELLEFVKDIIETHGNPFNVRLFSLNQEFCVCAVAFANIPSTSFHIICK